MMLGNGIEEWKKIIQKQKVAIVPDEKMDKFLEQLFILLVRDLRVDQYAAMNVIEDLAKVVREKYSDARFRKPNGEFIPNREHLKYMLRVIYTQIIEHVIQTTGDLQYEEMERHGRKFGIIFIDLEGLKTVNDLFTQDIGDKYLQLVSEKIMPEKNPQLKDYLLQQDLDYFTASAGGDEFTLVVNVRDWDTSERVLDQPIEGGRTVLEQVLLILQESVESINLTELLGMDNKVIAQKLERPVPDEFIWFAAAPAACATFKISKFWPFFREPKSPEQVMYKIMAAIISLAETSTKRKKEAYKKALRTSTDPEDQLVYELLTRNDEAMALYRENIRLRDCLTAHNIQLAID